MRSFSLSLSFRIGLAFHALNNEGGSGTNVMEPRRITIGDQEYDGISGEIVRRHMLEQLVRMAGEQNVPLSRAGRGLLPDRGKEDLTRWMENNGIGKLGPDHYAASTAELVASCTLRDVGGYLMALEKRADKAEGTLKRDSTFEVGWLISSHPAAVDMTQHAAYHPDMEHNLFVQNQRSGIYGGVMRFDLGRIGWNDWAWYDDTDPRVLDKAHWAQRADLLITAMERYMLSPGGAKQAGWLQHNGILEGAFMISRDGPAPFRSPVNVSVVNGHAAGSAVPLTVEPDEGYRSVMARVAEVQGERYTFLPFDDQPSFIEAVARVREAVLG